MSYFVNLNEYAYERVESVHELSFFDEPLSLQNKVALFAKTVFATSVVIISSAVELIKKTLFTVIDLSFHVFFDLLASVQLIDAKVHNQLACCEPDQSTHFIHNTLGTIKLSYAIFFSIFFNQPLSVRDKYHNDLAHRRSFDDPDSSDRQMLLDDSVGFGPQFTPNLRNSATTRHFFEKISRLSSNDELYSPKDLFLLSLFILFAEVGLLFDFLTTLLDASFHYFTSTLDECNPYAIDIYPSTYLIQRNEYYNDLLLDLSLIVHLLVQSIIHPFNKNSLNFS
jgi:hypothetical protein